MKKKIAAAILATLSLNASAGYINGNMLLERLRANDSLALGYVVGVADGEDQTLFLMRESGVKPPGRFACIPKDVQAGQLKDIVKRFLEDNPQSRHYGAAGLVSAALAVAFPC